MSLSIQVDMTDGVSPLLGSLLSALKDRSGLHEAIGKRAQTLTRNHLINIAATRHDTARTLGAAPTGHWANAAEKTTMESDGRGATVTVSHPGIGRAVRDVEIRPGPGRKWLTIPKHPEAYGTAAREIPDLVAIFGPRGGVLMRPQPGSEFGTVFYILTKLIKQKQDRTLLPSDEEYGVEALVGVRDFVDSLLAAGGAR